MNAALLALAVGGVWSTPPADAAVLALDLSVVADAGLSTRVTVPVADADVVWLFIGDGDDPAVERVAAVGKTDARGEAALRGVVPRRGWSRLFVAKEGYATPAGLSALVRNERLGPPLIPTFARSLAGSEPIAFPEPEIVVLYPAASVSGRVTDDFTGRPVAGALVTHAQRWPDTRDPDAWERWTALAAPHLARRPLAATTGAAGRYELTDLVAHERREQRRFSSAIPPPGTPVRLSAEGYDSFDPFYLDRVPAGFDVRLRAAAAR